MSGETGGSKIKDMRNGGSAMARYRKLVHGDIGTWAFIRNELVTLLFGNVPGALGLLLRKIFYPCMFKKCGRKTVFGKGVSFRHPCKIEIGDGCIIDDGAMIDAKGQNNRGIVLHDGVYIGRNTTVYCKNGNIEIGEKTNISSMCTLFSSNSLTIGKGCMIGAYTYILSGGEYDYKDETPYAEQSGMCTKGPLSIGNDCWIGARVTVLDGAGTIGDRSVLAACALVARPVAPHTVAAGVPAKEIKKV